MNDLAKRELILEQIEILELKNRIEFTEEDLKAKSLYMWILIVNSVCLFILCFLTKRPNPIITLTIFSSAGTILCLFAQLKRRLRIDKNKRRYEQLVAENVELLLIEESPILRKIGEDYLRQRS
jgi:hypothetical protein